MLKLDRSHFERHESCWMIARTELATASHRPTYFSDIANPLAEKTQQMNTFRSSVLVALLASPLTALALPTYSVLPLPVVGPSYAQPYAINNSGVVVGRVPFGGWDYQAFSSDGNTFTNIGASLSTTTSHAFAINNSGQVVGTGGSSGAFSFLNGVVTQLPTLGGPTSWAFGVNDNGAIVGISQNALQVSQAFLYQGGSISQLTNLTPALLDSSSVAYAINSGGVVVGTSKTSTGDVAVSWDANGVVTSLGTFGGTNSSASAINGAGQIVGWADYAAPASSHGAFLWQNGVMLDLGGLGGNGAAAVGINNIGQVVGSSSYANGNGAGFLWTETDGMVAIDTLLDPSYAAWG
ncbi:MAG: DUF3466 family protein, partial [Burkholderiaceae bacterium]|nr:DUF3466 family protein [Burkholderiaceae bacterium]